MTFVCLLICSLLLGASVGCSEEKPGQLYLKGKIALGEMQYDKAERVFKKVITLYPDAEQADSSFSALANIAGKTGEKDELVAFCEDFLKRHPESRNSYRVKMVLADVVDREKSLEIYRELFAKAIEDVGNLEDIDRAEGILTLFAEKFPEDEKADDALSALAQIAQAKKRELLAISRYQELLDRYPESELAYKAQFMIGFIYSEDLSNYPKAKEAYQKVIDNYPDSEIVPAAKWMLKNMGKSLDDLGILKDSDKK